MSDETPDTIRIEALMFVAGESPTSMEALRNWKNLESHSEMDDVRLTVVDVLVHPREALDNRVLATPTLVIAGPRRRLRYMGTLDDSKHVLNLIGHCRDEQKSA